MRNRRLGPAYAPQYTRSKQGIQSLRFEALEMGPSDEMGIVNRGEDTPDTVNLGVVFVDLRDNKEDRGEEKGKRESCDEWVGVNIDLLQSCSIAY